MSIQPAASESHYPNPEPVGAQHLVDQLVNQYWDDVKLVNLYPPVVAQALLDLEGTAVDRWLEPNPAALLETHGTCDNVSFVMRACLRERAAGRLIHRTAQANDDIRGWVRRVRLTAAE